MRSELRDIVSPSQFTVEGFAEILMSNCGGVRSIVKLLYHKELQILNDLPEQI